MTGLDIYTADYDPKQVYGTESAAGETGGESTPDEHVRDSTLVERAVRFGDAPLALLVEFDDCGGRVVWSFKARRGSETNRTEYYVADYRTDDSDLFRSLTAELESAHEDGWIVPHTGDLRWDLGFELWRVPAEVAGLGVEERAELFDRLQSDDQVAGSDQIVFGMSDHRSALTVVRAIQESGIECSVAVGTDGDPSALDGVDLVLLADGGSNFEPRSPIAERIFASEVADRTSAPGVTDRTPLSEVTDPSTSSTEREPDAESSGAVPTKRPGDEFGLGTRIAGAGLFVVLAFSCYSFVALKPVHPLTGLSTVGGLAGTLAAFHVYVYRMGPRDGPPPNQVEGLRERLLADQEWTLGVVAYGTFWAFLFPTMFRVGGRYVTAGDWLFGSISIFGNAALQVPLFVAALYALSVNLLSVVRRGTGETELPPETLRDLAVAHVLYGLPVLLATGLAQALWYHVIPAVPT